MDAWVLDIPAGTFFLDFSLMGLLLVIATWMRKKLKFLQWALIPNNLTAGLLGLLLGMNGLELLDLSSDRLGTYVYHLIAILFIALGLRSPQRKTGRSSMAFGVIFILTYLMQALIGMGIAFVLIYTLMPDLFPGIGLMMPLSFGMNPGIAYTIGKNWEAFGFTNGGIVGLSFAAMGFVTAYTIGIYQTRAFAKSRQATDSGSSFEPANTSGLLDTPDTSQAGAITTTSDVIESLTLHLSLIGAAYGLLILILNGLEAGLVWIGAEKEIQTLWSFHFVLSPVLALILRIVIQRLGAGHLIDDTTMTRSGNVVMDFMIVASIAAISVQVVVDYFLPIILLSLVVGVASWYFIKTLVGQVFTEYYPERLVTVFGNLTGTLQSGLVLLRVLDPEMKTPASYNLVYGSGLALGFGFPLLLLINLPVNYMDNLLIGFWLVFAGMAGYFILMALVWALVFLRKS